MGVMHLPETPMADQPALMVEVKVVELVDQHIPVSTTFRGHKLVHAFLLVAGTLNLSVR